MARILLTGMSGFIGSNLAAYLSPYHTIIGTYHTHPIAIPKCTAVQLDLGNSQKIFNLVANFRPEVIIHTAGIASVDQAEEDPLKTEVINSKCL